MMAIPYRERKPDPQPPLSVFKEIGVDNPLENQAPRPPLTYEQFWNIIKFCFFLCKNFKLEICVLVLINITLGSLGLAIPWTTKYVIDTRLSDMGHAEMMIKIAVLVIVVWGLHRIILTALRDWYTWRYLRPSVERHLGLLGAERVYESSVVERKPDAAKDVQPIMRQSRENIELLLESISREPIFFFFGMIGLLYFFAVVRTVPLLTCAVFCGMSIYIYLAYWMGVKTSALFDSRYSAKLAVQTLEIAVLNKALENARSGIPFVQTPYYSVLKYGWDKVVRTTQHVEIEWIKKGYFCRDLALECTKVVVLILALYYSISGIITVGDITLYVGLVDKAAEPILIVVLTQRRFLESREIIFQFREIAFPSKKGANDAHH